MWPKVLAQLIPQLIDLLPHVKRVVPMADKFLSSKAASDAALAAMAEGVRTDLGQVTTAHSALSQQVAAANAGFEQQLTDLAAAVRTLDQTAESSRLALETSLDTRISTLERQLRSLLVALIVLVVTLMGMTGWLIFAHTR